MLQRCPGCHQIIEIASATEHLLDECEKRDDYVLCDVTGLAILSGEVGEWENSSNRVEVPPGQAMCPLCYGSIPDEDDEWQKHLRQDCIENARNKGGI